MTDWSQIVEKHGRIVWATVYRLLHHEADSADCFQRTFLSALELSRKESISHWPALLQRLATARALEALRKRRREENRQRPLFAGSAVFAKTPEPGQEAQTSKLARDLRASLADIDGVQAQVFCLACLEGWRYEEIAEQLGLTVNHVGVLLNRARTTLRERLRAHEPDAARRQREEQK